MKSLITKPRVFLIGAIILAGAVALATLPSNGQQADLLTAKQDSTVSDSPVAEEQGVDVPALNTVQPTYLRNDSSVVIIGRILSHETANIYPRRDGIVSDVLVDIGDPVKKDQVVARLLPRGVEGESDALIGEKYAMLGQKQADYKTTLVLAEAKTEDAYRKLEEKKTMLENARSNAGALIREKEVLSDTTTDTSGQQVEAARQNIEVAQSSFKLAMTKLEKRIAERERKIADALENIDQRIEQAEVAAAHARQEVEQLLAEQGINTGEVTSRGTFRAIKAADLPYEFGFLDPKSIAPFVDKFNLYRNRQNAFLALDAEQKSADIKSLLREADQMLNSLQTMLNASSPGSNISRETIASLMEQTRKAQSTLLNEKEKLEDAISAHSTLLTSEDDTISALEREIEKQKTMVTAAEENLKLAESQLGKSTGAASEDLSKTKTVQESLIAQLEAEVKTAEAQVKVIEAEQQRLIEMQKSAVDVSRSQLNTEQAERGHVEIRSPFSGTVSKRFLQVGESAMPSKAAFELVDVQTTLSAKAKQEVEFGLPEELAGILTIGDQLEFFLQENADQLYQSEVTRISPQVDFETHTFTTRAKVLNDVSLPHHTSVRVRLSGEGKPIFSVPSIAVKRAGDSLGSFLWVLPAESDKPEKQTVEVISEDGEFAEITGEISTETQIVTDPPEIFLKNN